MTGPTRRAVTAAGLALPIATAAPSLLVRAAAAPRPDDYKAIVLIFLEGGCDPYDTLIPTGRAEHREWSASRGAMLAEYGHVKRPRPLDRLLRIAPDETGAPQALPPEMPNLAAAFASGRALGVANVGPMLGPVTPKQLSEGTAEVPSHLFSHAHQQVTWQRLGRVSSASTGWGGRMADAAGQDGPFGAVRTGRDAGFLDGAAGPGLTVGSTRGPNTVLTHERLWGSAELADLIRAQASAGTTAPGVMERDVAALQRHTVEVNERLGAMLASTKDGESIATHPRHFDQKLAVVAKMIALRGQAGARRQVFYAGLGGFDTHQQQPQRLAALQEQLDQALGRFTRWLSAEGLSDAVTIVIGTEFGRTLIATSTGTDHGWGAHAFVVGGAVNGGRVLGEVPPARTGHARDAGRGRLIPGLALEQLAVPIARWFGVPEADMGAVFPYADRFDTDALPVMRA